MPNISLVTPEVTSAVIRPAILEIARQIMDITKIPKETKIVFNGEIDSTYQAGSTISQSQDERNNTTLPYSNRLSIEVSNDYNEGAISSTAVRQSEHLPVFNDERLGIIIKPIYSKNDFTISFTYRSASEREGKSWRDSIRTHISMMRDVNLHEISYHYLIPQVYISILKEIHRLRENVAPYDEDFNTYLRSNSSTRVTAVSNQTASNVSIGVRETQIRILGLYDFTIAPEKGNRDGEGSAWVTTFSYKVSFDVPLMVNMRYPIMIHNQMLEYPYVSDEQSIDLDTKLKSYSSSIGDFSMLESNVELDRYLQRSKTVMIPSFDDFVPTSKPYATQPLVSALCSVDTTDNKLLLNLNELGDYQIDGDILELMTEEYPYLTIPYKSIFHLSLYRWSALISDRAISVDNALNLKSKEALSLRENHRVVLSMVTNLTLLDKAALQRLKDFRKAGRKALLAIGATRDDLHAVASKVNLTSLVPELPPASHSIRSIHNTSVQLNTVQISHIVSTGKLDLLKNYQPFN